MAAQSAAEQQTRDQFDAWSIGERMGKPLGRFGAAVDQPLPSPQPVTVRPVALNPKLWPDTL